MKQFQIFFLFLIMALILSCSDKTTHTKTTILTGSWQLVESSSDLIDPYLFYHLIFENGEIFSTHNIYDQPVIDCKSKKYSVNENIMSFKHYDMEYNFEFEVNRKKDTLLLNNRMNWYKFLKVKEMQDYKTFLNDNARNNFGKIQNDDINEASGIIASRKNPGIIWTHNDGGGKNRIFGFDYHGDHVIEIWLDNCDLIDCEDIAIMNIDGKDFILLGDIGDNKAKRDEIYLYLIPEMEIDPDIPDQSISMANIQKITLQYPDGNRDSEAFVVLPDNKIMIITKREQANRFYTAKIDLDKNNITMDFQLEIPLTKIVGADLLKDGENLIFKNYENIYSMVFDYSTELPNIFTVKNLDYEVEPQGEAICWDLLGNGYFTLSEERNKVEAILYYYPFLPFWMR